MENYDINDYLKDDKELQKAVIQELLVEVETRDNLVEHFRKEAINWTKISNDCIKDIENYKQTLQEIKAIAKSAIAKQQEYKKDFVQILDLITKAEEE
jgi:hypothetical protein